MTWLVVAGYSAFAFVVLRAIRDARRRTPPTAWWEADLRRRQLDREEAESRTVGWRK